MYDLYGRGESPPSGGPYKRPSVVRNPKLTRPRREHRGCNGFYRGDSISSPTLDLQHADPTERLFSRAMGGRVTGKDGIVAGVVVMLPGPGHRVLK